MVAKDTEMMALRDKEAKFRTELKKAYEEIERYKQQLSAGVHRENALEQMRVQVELDWQRRCEKAMAEQSLANEQLIRSLIRAKDQAQAKLRAKEQDLHDLSVLLHSVKMERDQAIQGLTPKVDFLASEEIRRLQEQNNILKAVIIQRKDTEGFNHVLFQTSLSHQVQQQTVPPAASTGKITVSSPPQPTDIRPKPGSSGGACLTNGTDTSTLNMQEVRAAHLESTLDKVLKQSEVLQQLQEDSLSLQKKQLAAGSFGSVRDARTSGPLLRSRLKQAACCIARLSREKQQLIEMGNRLRSQLSMAGVQVPQNSVSVEESMEPERNAPTDRQHRPWTQEQLQDQLTAQSSRCTKNSLLLSKPQRSVHLDVGLQPCLSRSESCLSIEESPPSLRELWELLDHELSDSVFSAGEGELTKQDLTDSTVPGSQMTRVIPANPRLQQRTKPSKAPSRSTQNGKVSGTINKIRNYNLKD